MRERNPVREALAADELVDASFALYMKASTLADRYPANTYFGTFAHKVAETYRAAVAARDGARACLATEAMVRAFVAERRAEATSC
jgi:hypothetical protein